MFYFRTFGKSVVLEPFWLLPYPELRPKNKPQPQPQPQPQCDTAAINRSDKADKPTNEIFDIFLINFFLNFFSFKSFEKMYECFQREFLLLRTTRIYKISVKKRTLFFESVWTIVSAISFDQSQVISNFLEFHY